MANANPHTLSTDSFILKVQPFIVISWALVLVYICLSYVQARYYRLNTQVVELYSSYITVLVCRPGLVLNPLLYQRQSLAHLCLLSLSLSLSLQLPSEIGYVRHSPLPVTVWQHTSNVYQG